jgi:hypothetical protein
VKRLLIGLLVTLAACSSQRDGSQRAWERRAVDAAETTSEAKVVYPAYPADADLIDFSPNARGGHRYFVDAKSIAIGDDGVARFSVVIKTAGGATNVTYEGIRCASREKRIYALGQKDRTWVEARRSEWEAIQRGRANEYQEMLYADAFCVDGVIARNRDVAIRSLRYGTTRHKSP